MRGPWLSIAALAAALLGGCTQDKIALLPDPSRVAPSLRKACVLAEQRCSRCHDLERILIAHHAMVDWRVYVERMRRMPGSGISQQDGAVILTCLEHVKWEQQQRDSL